MGKKVKKETEAPAADVFDPVNVETKNAKTAVLMLDSPEQEVKLRKTCPKSNSRFFCRLLNSITRETITKLRNNV